MGGLLDEQDEQLKFRFIGVEKANFPIQFMCRHLRVSRSGYYAWRNRKPSARTQQDAMLTPLVRAEFDAHKRGCGARQIVGALRIAGHRTSRRRVARLMRCQRLQHRLKRRYCRARSVPVRPAAPNVLGRAFAPSAPNKVWAADITPVFTKKGWAHVAVVLDIGVRRVVGWCVSTAVDAELTLRALSMAVHERRPPPGVIHHSDRGVQYTAGDYQAALDRYGFLCSMSRKGNCWDNAVVESFFSAMKRELPNEGLFRDANELEFAVFSYVASYYNTTRRHSTLGYLTPIEYEMRSAV